MLPTPPQPDAAGAASGEKEMFGEASEFHNWTGKGAADLLLPEIKEASLILKI